ncbi:MAG: NADH-quinone oxidoreductase subunit N, partial [Acidobacteriota bacterium]
AGGAALWSLLVVMMVTSGIGLFYYLRVIVTMFMERAVEQTVDTGMPPLPIVAGLTLAALTMLLAWLGVYPGPLIALIRVAVTSVT